MDEQFDPAMSFSSRGSSSSTLRHWFSHHSPMVFKTPLLLNLEHTQNITYPDHRSNLSGDGWEMGMIHSVCIVGGTWRRGRRKLSAIRGMLLSTWRTSPATPQGHKICFISMRRFQTTGTSILKLFLLAPVCLCLAIHATVPSDVKYLAWNLPG